MMRVVSSPGFWNQLAPTPLVAVQPGERFSPVWCKLEFLNPSGSTKDRIARHILEKAWRRGEIAAGSVVVEASSGSTSIALAMACSQMGLRFHAFLPQTATNERLMMIKALGGEVFRIDAPMADIMARAASHAEACGAFQVRQFENEDNAEAHRVHTASEMLRQVPGGRVDAVVSGIGTGGTLVGLHGGLEQGGCQVIPVAAIPTGTLYQGSCECCSFSGKVPGVMECSSEIFRRWRRTSAAARLREIQIPEQQCIDWTRQLWKLGFPVGPSSGLNLAAAAAVAQDLGPDALVATVFPDRMERYFSHPVFVDSTAAGAAGENQPAAPTAANGR